MNAHILICMGLAHQNRKIDNYITKNVIGTAIKAIKNTFIQYDLQEAMQERPILHLYW